MNEAHWKGALAPMPLGDSAESAGGPLWLTAGQTWPSVNAPHGLPRVLQRHCGSSPFGPKSQTTSSWHRYGDLACPRQTFVP